MVLLLAGCGKKRQPVQEALDLRTALLEASGCSFTAAIQAEYGDRIHDFTVKCDYTPGKEARVEVLQPEEIAGIAATMSNSGATVKFEDMALDFGKMANGKVSPMEAAWLLPECWSGAYISTAGKDGELHRITYLDGYGDGELVVDTWVDASGTPVYGEIAYQGVRCLRLDISQFQLKG